MPPTEKPCRACGRVLPLASFNRYRQNADGRQHKCRQCFAAYNAQRAAAFAQRAADLPPTKFCTRCERTLPASAFYRVRSAKDGLSGYCRECCARYARSPTGRDVQAKQRGSRKRRLWAAEYKAAGGDRANAGRHRGRYPERIAARWALREAVRTGRIARADRCEGCGARARTEGHHHRGYDRAHWLDVQWLCKRCHAVVDRKPT